MRGRHSCPTRHPLWVGSSPDLGGIPESRDLRQWPIVDLPDQAAEPPDVSRPAAITQVMVKTNMSQRAPTPLSMPKCEYYRYTIRNSEDKFGS